VDCDGNGWISANGSTKPCACQREKRIEQELPPRYRRAKLSDFSSTVQATVRQWLTSPAEGLLLSGTVGSGKTHLAAAIVRERIEHNNHTSFRRMADLYSALQDSFRLNISEAEVLRPYINARLMVLDDLGSGTLSDFVRRSTLEILDQRLNRERPTIVTTNWELADIAEKMDDRIGSRLATYKNLRLAGADRRLALVAAGGR
jgi:DNA replication protein DnaC